MAYLRWLSTRIGRDRPLEVRVSSALRCPRSDARHRSTTRLRLSGLGGLALFVLALAGVELGGAAPVPGTTERVSVNAAGEEANGSENSVFQISADGCQALIISNSSNLVPNDINGQYDIFVRDCTTGTVDRVSVRDDESEATHGTTNASISADGQKVAFVTEALEPGQSGRLAYVRDRAMGTTALVPAPAGLTVGTAAISGDGRTVAYNNGGGAGLYLADLTAGTFRRVATFSAALMDGPSPISFDGRYVIFTTTTQVTPDDGNALADAYVFDATLNSFERVSVGPDGENPTYGAYQASLSPSGRYAIFSGAFFDNGGIPQLGGWLRDRDLDITRRVDVTPSGGVPNSNANGLSSADTCEVAYESPANDIVPGDSNSASDVFVWNCQTNETELASVNSQEEQGQGDNYAPFLTADGMDVSFVSDATNLVPNDTTENLDAFVRHREVSASLEITGIVEDADSVARYGRFQASISLSETFVNPFDPDEIAVDVTFTSPTGRTQVVPAFWYEPFTVVGSPDWEQYQSTGQAGWRVRFAPEEVGTYAYSVAAAAGPRTAVAVSGSFQAVVSATDGFVRADDQNSRYLRFDSGDPYIPVGHNVAFEEGGPPLNGVGYYTDLLGSLGRAGENWTRVWMTDFNRSALEWGEGHFSGFYHGPGVYSLPSAWRMDRVLEQAEANGVFVQLVLSDHGQFSTRGGDRWGVRCAASDPPPCQPGDTGYDPGNAYSDYNGGPIPLAQPELFFSNLEARELMKKRLRYIVARWGAFRSVLAWELMNEFLYVGTDGTNPFTSPQLRSDIVDWHADMSQYLKANDPSGHLVTTSQAIQEAAGDIADLNAIWALPAIDLVQIHWYVPPPGRMNVDLNAMINELKTRYDKPVIVGELGLPSYPNPDPPPPDFVNPERFGSGDAFSGFDPLGFVRSGNPDFSPENRDHLTAGTHLHNAMWSTAVAESSAMYWWWGTYIAADPGRNRVGPSFPLNERLVPPLNSYLAGEDWATLGLDGVSIATSGSVVAVGSRSSKRAFVWVRDAQNEYATGSGPGNLAGRTISGANIDIPGLDDGIYRVRAFDTWTGAGVTSTRYAGATGGTLRVNLPSFTRDIALKIDPIADADRDGVEDSVDADGGDGSSPAGAFVDDTGDGKISGGGIVSGSVAVVDAADPKGVRLTAIGGDAVLSVCSPAFEIEVPDGGSVTVTCGSVRVEEVLEGPVTLVVSELVSVVFPDGTSATVASTADGDITVSNVVNASGAPVTLVVNGESRAVPAGGLTIDTVDELLKQLQAKSVGVGSGKTLAKLAADARKHYLAGRLSAACSSLAEYVSAVQAQAGKRIPTAIAADLIDRARTIRALLRC